jgi:hypothetical protein
MENLNDLILEKTMALLTLRYVGPEKRDAWLRKGFKKISRDKLKEYWKNKIAKDEEALKMYQKASSDYMNHMKEVRHRLSVDPEHPIHIKVEGIISQEQIPALLFNTVVESEIRTRYKQLKSFLLKIFTNHIKVVPGENIEIDIKIVSNNGTEKSELLEKIANQVDRRGVALFVFKELYGDAALEEMYKDVSPNTQEEPPPQSPQENTTPSLWSMAKNAGKAALKSAASGFKMVTDAQYEERTNICKSCEFWNKEAFAGTGQCTKCGCSTATKLKLATEKCPIDKWLPTV